MSVAVDKAASAYGPMARTTPGNGTLGQNVIRYATSTTNTSAALDVDTLQDGASVTPWAGKWVRIKNEDTASPLEFAFSVGAGTLVYGETSTFAAGDVNCGWRIGPGETFECIVPRDATHVCWIQPSGATAATIAMYVAEGPAVIR